VYSWESEMVAGCELWRKSRKRSPVEDLEDDGLEWARRKMRASEHLPPLPSLPSVGDEARGDQKEEATDSVLKVRVDQSWNVRLLWEGRVKELLVSAGVGLGPSSFSPSSWATATAGSGQSGGGRSPSYWRGFGVSVLYSS
jgi:distribution and morphology protein 10